ncbi:uncharacterized protein [Dysidea avara]|uniref:uncharacterized protein n=1 Tax=Dysidea avara TaxID=196820 RepID=UPI003321C0AA
MMKYSLRNRDLKSVPDNLKVTSHDPQSETVTKTCSTKRSRSSCDNDEAITNTPKRSKTDKVAVSKRRSKKLTKKGTTHYEEPVVSDDDDNMYDNYTCAHCKVKFMNKSNFDIHLKCRQACRDANPQVFKCGKCGEELITLINLQQHIRRHDQNDSLGLKNIQWSKKAHNDSHWGEAIPMSIL